MAADCAGQLNVAAGDPADVVDNVHTFRLVLGQTPFGLAGIPHVFESSLCLQGLECSSSPTSGTVFPQVRSLFLLRVLTTLDSTRPRSASPCLVAMPPSTIRGIMTCSSA